MTRLRAFAFSAVGLLVAWFVVAELGRWRAAGPGSLAHDELAVRALQGRVLTDAESLAYPVAIAAVDSYLVVLDAHLDPAVHLISREGRPLRALGRDGEGPGEFRAPRSVVAAIGRPDAFWVYDVVLRRLTLVEPTQNDGPAVGGLAAGEAVEETATVTLHSDAVVTDPAWIDPDALLALGFFPEGRFGRFDGEGTKLGTVGELPEMDREVPPTVLAHAWQGRMERRPDGSLLAVGFRHAGRLEIFGPDGRRVRRASVPFDFPPRFWVAEAAGGPVLGTGEDLRFGYVDVAVTQDRIYGLFSGRLRGAYPDRGPFGEHVHVFDWDGGLLEVWRLQADALALAVAPEEGTLYTVGHAPTPAVMRYEISFGGRR